MFSILNDIPNRIDYNLITMQMPLDYNANTYVAVFLTPTSIYTNQPISLQVFPSVASVGNVGQLQDTQLLSVPKTDWEIFGDQIIATLKEDKSNIARVDVQELRARKKRGDEL